MPRITRAAVIACAVGAAVPSVAPAQERLEVFTAVGGVNRLLEVDASVSRFGVVHSTIPIPDGVVPAEAVALSGGRFVVWTSATDRSIALLDRRDRSLRFVQLPVPGSLLALIADRRQPRVFAFTVGSTGEREVWLIDAQGPAPRRLFSASELVTSVVHAPAADLLVVNWTSAPQHFTEVIDVSSGATIRRLRRADWLFNAVVSDDGRWMWGINSPFGIGALDTVDTTTGSTIARGPVIRPPLALNADGGEIVVSEAYDEFALGLDPLTLQERWRRRIDLPLPLKGHHATNQVLPGRWMTGAYVLHVDNRNDSVCQGIDLLAIAAGGQSAAAAPLLPHAGATGLSCRAVGVLVRSPFAPRDLTSTVAGGAVTLGWTDPGDTSEFEVEYGFVPSQRAGTMRVGRTTALTIPNVSPGTYYVRVRALNEVGPSPPSADVRVVVP